MNDLTTDQVYLANLCDPWLTYSSFKLFGVFNDRQQLNEGIKYLINDKAIEFREECTLSDIPTLTCMELNRYIKYLHIEIINLNERHQ